MATGDLTQVVGLGTVSDSLLAKISARLMGGTQQTALKRLREFSAAVVDERSSLYGSISHDIKIPMIVGESLSWACANLPALTSRMNSESEAFSRLLENMSQGSSYQRPVRLVLYTDEVTPGNVLNPDNQRKIWAFYVSFLEAGACLTNDSAWLFAGAFLSTSLKHARGGLGGLIRQLLRSYFLGDLSLRHAGVNITFATDENKTIYFDLHAIIADAAAIQHIYDVKGYGGLRPCLKCKNVVKDGADLENDGYLVPTSCPRHSEFDIATDADIFAASDIVHAVARQARTKKAVLQIETAYGINVAWDGLLQDVELRPYLRPSSGTRYDAMHIEFCNGNFQDELMCFMQRVSDIGLGYADLQAVFRADWRFPKAFEHVIKYAKNRIFEGTRISESGYPRLSASEALASLPLVRYFAESVVEATPDCPPDVLLALHSLYAMVRFGEAIDGAKKRKTDAPPLLACMQRYLEAQREAYPDANTKPKMHFGMHLHSQVQPDEGALIGCFALERKHLIPKGFGDNAKNPEVFAKYLLPHVVMGQLRKLSENPNTFSAHRLEGRTADSPEFARILGTPTALVAKQGLVCHIPIAHGDVILAQNHCVAVVDLLVLAGGIIHVVAYECTRVARVTRTSSRWRKTDAAVFVQGEEISSLVTWAPSADNTMLCVQV